jgi:hypothetical protein
MTVSVKRCNKILPTVNFSYKLYLHVFCKLWQMKRLQHKFLITSDCTLKLRFQARQKKTCQLKVLFKKKTMSHTRHTADLPKHFFMKGRKQIKQIQMKTVLSVINTYRIQWKFSPPRTQKVVCKLSPQYRTAVRVSHAEKHVGPEL